MMDEIVINNEILLLCIKVAGVKDYSKLKTVVKDNAMELAELHNAYAIGIDKLDINVPNDAIDDSIDRSWGIINNLSEESAELLEACTDSYTLAKKIIAYSRGEY